MQEILTRLVSTHGFANVIPQSFLYHPFFLGDSALGQRPAWGSCGPEMGQKLIVTEPNTGIKSSIHIAQSRAYSF